MDGAVRSITIGALAILAVACAGRENGPDATVTARTTPKPPATSTPGDAIAYATIAYSTIAASAEGNAQDLDPALDPYYCWAIDVAGVLVVAGAAVDRSVVNTGAATVSEMLGFRPEMREKLAALSAKLAITGPNETITDIPELRHLRNAALYDDRQYEDLGGYSGGVIAVARVEGVVGLAAGANAGPDILVHEFAHQINALGISDAEWRRWRTIYTASRAKGLWEGSYAGRNYNEFFAELTQSYFAVNPFQENGVNGTDNLRAYDPAAAAFLAKIYGPR